MHTCTVLHTCNIQLYTQRKSENFWKTFPPGDVPRNGEQSKTSHWYSLRPLYLCQKHVIQSRLYFFHISSSPALSLLFLLSLATCYSRRVWCLCRLFLVNFIAHFPNLNVFSVTAERRLVRSTSFKCADEPGKSWAGYCYSSGGKTNRFSYGER